MASNSPPPPADMAPPRGSWLTRNLTTIISVAIGAFLVYYLFLKDAEDSTELAERLFNIAKVVFGLGLIIFIHELGHFLAAKWCDVYVRTFSIGFGPPLLGICQFQRGETTYKIGWIPLGGYVHMMGEGEENEENSDDPRSYKNKKVWQRMIIISAGVAMNLLLGWICYAGVLLTNGIPQHPGVVGSVAPGGPAWKAGLQPGAHIMQIGPKENPHYKELQRVVMRAGKGNPIPVVYEAFEDGKMVRRETNIAPTSGEEVLAPMLLVRSSNVPTLTRKISGIKTPVEPGSVAAEANPPFEFRDRIIAATDPVTGQITPLRADPRSPESGRLDYYDLDRRFQQLLGKPITLRVQRDSGTVDIPLKASFGRTVGLRMRMGEIVALREGSSAVAVGLRARDGSTRGDVLHIVEVTQPDGSVLRFSAEHDEKSGEKKGEFPLDPIKLPTQLAQWAASNPSDRSVRLTVKRSEGHVDVDKQFTLQWDTDWDLIDPTPGGSGWPIIELPMAIGALGLAYDVQNVIAGIEPGSPAAATGLKPSHEIKAIEFKLKDRKGGEIVQKRELKENQWAYYGSFIRETVQLAEVTLVVNEDGQRFTLQPVSDEESPLADRGLIYDSEQRILKADGFLDAMGIAAKRVGTDMMWIYENLAGMIRGRLSFKAVSGPISIAKHSFDLAGRNTFEFILFIAFFNVNLAVVNFLPIPVLDGGHMVFLVYELLRGKPPSDRWRFILTIMGLVIVLGLMILGLALDFGRYLWEPLKNLFG